MVVVAAGGGGGVSRAGGEGEGGRGKRGEGDEGGEGDEEDESERKREKRWTRGETTSGKMEMEGTKGIREERIPPSLSDLREGDDSRGRLDERRVQVTDDLIRKLGH